MAANLASSLQPEAPPRAGHGVLLSLVAAAVFPLDRVLSGMVAAGQGIEAICRFLGLSRTALDASLVRLGLRTPHDRPFRGPAKGHWSVRETMLLIAWWVLDIHPETIGQRLQGRSANAVRAKARRLGLYRRDRKALRRVDPATLREPDPGFGLPAETLGSSQESDFRASASSAAGRCGTAAGGVQSRPDPMTGSVVTLRPGLPPSEIAVPTSARRLKASSRPAGQRELQLFTVLPGDGLRAAAAPDATSDPPVPPIAPVRGETPPAELQPLPDLAWIKAAKDRPRNRAVVEFLSNLYFGGQDYKTTARQCGLTTSTVASFYDRIDLPRDSNRGKFSGGFDAARAKATLAASGYYLEICRKTRRLFWQHRKHRGKIIYNRETRREMGSVMEWEKHRSEPICLQSSCLC